jgi:hypothetical protein
MNTEIRKDKRQRGQKTAQKKQTDRKTTGKKKGRKSRIPAVVLVLFSLLYLPALWNWIFHGNIETQVLYTGLLEMKVPTEGVFIRDQVSVASPGDGIIIPKVNSGDRVPNKYEFAVLIDESGRYSLEKIEELEKEIIRHIADNFPESLDEDIQFVEQVQSEVNKLSNIALNKSFLSLSRIKSVLDRMLYQRNREVLQKHEGRLYLQYEKDKLEQLRKNLKANAVSIQADFSGIVVWDRQNINEKHSPEFMEQLTIDELMFKDDMAKQQEEVLPIGVDEAFPVSTGQAFARLINNSKSWYVCLADTGRAEEIMGGTKLSLRVDGLDETIPCIVETVQPIGDKTKIIVSFNRMIEKTVYLRNAKAELVVKSVQGLKVPVRSLINRNTVDNTADIMIVRFNRAVRKRVSVIAELDNFAIIEPVSGVNDTNPASIFDIYVVNPQNIEEGQVIE